MDFIKIGKTTIFHFLVAIMLAALPVVGAAAPQQSDINKPTRTRVKATDKKQNDNKNKSAASKDPKSPAAAAAAKGDVKDKDDSKAPAAAPKKDDKPAADPKADKQPGQDTTTKPAKPAQPAKQPKKILNTDTEHFNGIDVSYHQGFINWAELRKNKSIQYVYIRATVGSDVVDANYKENIKNARKHGFRVGSYHYMTNLSSVRGQFENFRRMVDKNEQDVLPMIDVEVRNRWNKQQLRDSLVVFCKLIEDYYGCKPIIYTYETFFRENLGIAFENYPLFIARYNNQRPNIGGVKWVMWQFSDAGYFSAVKGNKGQVDLSRFNEGYTIKDILYHPSKSKPKASVKDAVDHKEKPATINATEKKGKENKETSTKQQTAKNKQRAQEQKKLEEQQKKAAEKEARVKERNKKHAQEEAAKKAKEKEEADKKAKQKAEQQKREQERKAAAQKAAEDKAKRKAAAQKAREDKAKQEAAKKASKTNKSASVRGALTRSQRNDSIRAAKQSGRKINKSSADND